MAEVKTFLRGGRESWKHFYTLRSLMTKRYVCLLAVSLVICIVYKSAMKMEERFNTTTPCPGRYRIAFIKTHKTAGSTITNIVQRFGMKHGLRFLLPEPAKTYLWSDRRAQLKTPVNETYEILCNHVVYNKTALSKLLKGDTLFFTILRHPVSQFLSSFSYYSNIFKARDLLTILGTDPLDHFLQNPEQYENLIDFTSYTNNRMSFDLGIPPSAFKNPDVTDAYIRQIDEEFRLVMLTEYFDESLVLLRRHFCWQFEDIVYVKLNVRAFNGYRITQKMFELITKWQSADMRLYDHFYRKFWREVGKYGHDFWDELEAFKRIEQKINMYCFGLNSSSSDTRLTNGQNSSLTISKTLWNNEFDIDSEECKLFQLNEVSFTNKLRVISHKKER